MRTFENRINFWLMRTCAQQNFNLFPPMRSRSAIFQWQCAAACTATAVRFWLMLQQPEIAIPGPAA
jgi:hypothetical protein